MSSCCSRLAFTATSRLGLEFVLWLVEIESTCCSESEIDSRCNEYAQIVDSLILRFITTASLVVATASVKFAATRLSLTAASGHCLVIM